MKINKNTILDEENKFEPIELDEGFVFGDIFIIVENSTISKEKLRDLISCRYIEELVEESKIPSDNIDRNIEYLQLMRCWSYDDKDPKGSMENFKVFDGVGRKGEIPEDVIGTSEEAKFKEMSDNGWRQPYAVEMTPVNELLSLPVVISKEVKGDIWNKGKPAQISYFEDMPYRFIDFLEAIFWELTFYGSPAKRNETMEQLN